MTTGRFFNKTNMSVLEELTNSMKEAYTDSFAAMDQAGSLAIPDMLPDHEIELHIKLAANIEGHAYRVDATVFFDIELAPALSGQKSPMAELVSALSKAGVDLGEDADAVVEQLAQPRALGAVREVTTRNLELHGPEGLISTELNVEGMLLVTISHGRMMINCENVFSYPQHPSAFFAMPTMEAMQSHVVINMEHMDDPVSFEWTEPEQDNLHIQGSVRIQPTSH